LERKGDEEPPPRELKPLPDGVRYEVLDENISVQLLLMIKFSR
jgi:hypothetical protein